MGIADAFELGWKLATVINGFADPELLKTYEQERRPVVQNTIERSGVHMKVHMDVGEILQGRGNALDDDSEEGRELRQKIHEHYQKNDGENFDLGIEMGYRYESASIFADESSSPPDSTPLSYTPSTYPGSRAPHVYLNDGTPIFDHYGKYFSLIEFSDGTDLGSEILLAASHHSWTPVKHVKLIDEDHAYHVWGQRLVLVRPDGHVVWRGSRVSDLAQATKIVAAMRGDYKVPREYPKIPLQQNGVQTHPNTAKSSSSKPIFTSTVGSEAQTQDYHLEKMGDFQQ